MAHAFHERPRVRALGDEQRSVGVPQVVKSQLVSNAEGSVPLAGAVDPDDLQSATVRHDEHIGLVSNAELPRRAQGSARGNEAGRRDGQRATPLAGALDPEDLGGAVLVEHEHVGLVTGAELLGGGQGCAGR